jgi:hypothetical protein
MLVRPDDGAIDIMDIPVELSCGVGALLDRGKEASPETCFAPAGEATGNGDPAAIPLGEVTPGGSCADDPQNAIQEASVISGRAACVRFLRGKQRL